MFQLELHKINQSKLARHDQIYKQHSK